MFIQECLVVLYWACFLYQAPARRDSPHHNHDQRRVLLCEYCRRIDAGDSLNVITNATGTYIVDYYNVRFSQL